MGFLNLRETAVSPRPPIGPPLEAGSALMLENAGTAERSPAGIWYSSPHVAEEEKRILFGEHWLPLAPVPAIPDSKVGAEFDLCGHPVHLRRDPEKGELKALSMVCRHRGATVRPRAMGKGLCFVCPYHGWTYGDDGARMFCPEWPAAANPIEPGLQAWDCREWAGFAWLKRAESKGLNREASKSPHSIALPVAPWDALAAGPKEFDLNGLEWQGTWWDELACDWKVFVDNYLDGGYHLGPVHPELNGALDGGAYQTVVHDRAVLQWAPAQAPTPAQGGGGKQEGMAEVRSGDEARYWWIWPNFFWNHYGDYLDTNVVYPAGPGKCRVRFDFFFSPHGRFASESPRVKSIEAAKLIQEQDRLVCESVQIGMASQEYRGGPYHPIRELGMRRFHRLWRESLGLAGEAS